MQSIEEQIVSELGNIFTCEPHEEEPEDAEFSHIGPVAKSKFGAFVWPTLKALVSSLPDESPLPQDTRKSIMILLVLVAARLPCPECRAHFTDRVKRAYPHTASRANILRWICNAENEVRVENGKQPFSREEIIQYLHSMTHRTRPARLPALATPITHQASHLPAPADTGVSTTTLIATIIATIAVTAFIAYIVHRGTDRKK
jgi:hypothetical protein